jgi:hypothetical protein
MVYHVQTKIWLIYNNARKEAQKTQKQNLIKFAKKSIKKQQTCVLRFQIIKSDFKFKKYFKLCSHMNWFEIKIQTTNLTWFIPNN